MISVPKSDIEMIFNLLGAKLSNSSGSSTVKLNKSGKPKKQNSNKGKPTCHGDFVKMICEKMKDDVAAFKAANPDQKGAHLVFAANYKKENAEEVAAFEAKWKEEHPKDATSAPVAAPVAAPVGAPVGAPAAKKPVKAAKKATPVITTPVVAPIEVAAVAELLPFSFNGATYLRLGSKLPSGDALYTSGHLWMSKKGAKGPHYGELKEDGSIDMEAEEPTV